MANDNFWQHSKQIFDTANWTAKNNHSCPLMALKHKEKMNPKLTVLLN